jgi:hypothetical protein
MDFNKKCCIVIIIIIFTYILIRLFHKRFSIEKQYNANTIEGFNTTNPTVSNINSNNLCDITITNDVSRRLDKYTDKKLQNYAIKSSMNSAYDGINCSKDMLGYVLSRGCRFIDLEVYCKRSFDTNNNDQTDAVVSVSEYDTNITEIGDSLTISEAVQYLVIHGFSNDVPNYTDPLFIQFRPYSNKDNAADVSIVYAEIKRVCTTYVTTATDTKYIGTGITVTNETKINTFLEKIILVMDTSQINDNELTSIINIKSLNTFSYSSLPAESPLKLSKDNSSTTVTTINQCLFIDKDKKSYYQNSDSYSLINNYSCQIVPMLFFDNGSDLHSYEMLFNSCGGAIVPLPIVYSKVNIDRNPYIAYPQPMFALPNYNNQTISIIIITACLGIAGYIVYKESTII